MFDVHRSKIERVIIHKVYPKVVAEENAKTEKSATVLNLGVSEMDALVDRLSKAFTKGKRFFKLEVEDPENPRGFVSYSSKMKKCTNEEFIEYSGILAEVLALSHSKRTIPGGLLLVLDGFTELKKHFVIVIKAELQEAFTILKEGEVTLLKDLFLSPAKDFYKVGLLVEDRNLGKDVKGINKNLSCYMYDDQFFTGKKDLAEYFYRGFLGFTTDNNAKMICRDFFSDVSLFFENNVESYEDMKGLNGALKTLFREDVRNIVDPKKFGDYILDGELKKKYEIHILNKYPHPFEKDLALVDRKLKRGNVKLRNGVKLEGPKDFLDENVSIYNAKSELDLNNLSLELNTGNVDQIVTLSTTNVSIIK